MNLLNTERRPGGSIFFILLIALMLTASPAAGHGGKKHGPDLFTPLKALQNATILFDKLVAAGKLEETWETGLVSVDISIPEILEKGEVSVVFKRQQGEPRAVYFFFKGSGDYAGSNFTGR